MSSRHTLVYMLCMHRHFITSQPIPTPLPRSPTPARKHSLFRRILQALRIIPKPSHHSPPKSTISHPLFHRQTMAQLPQLCPSCEFTFLQHGIGHQEACERTMEHRELFNVYGPLTPTPFWTGNDGGWVLLFKADEEMASMGGEIERGLW